jgi:AGCS family alanine or glycine:cation symporter
MSDLLNSINGILWHDSVLYIVLGTGVLFTIWSRFGQYRALTHGVQVIRGKYDRKEDPGAINHFQALSTALSATVGLGNIGGVALAIALGGPGAVFWMWMVGIFGMALKMTEVTLAMLYRDTSDPENPHGGPMWVVKKGLAKWSESLAPAGAAVGGVFCVTLIISTITGGNMFQAWNVAEITNNYFPSVPKFVVGVMLAITVALVIIGGIKRIGAVAGRLVPIMCVLYLVAAFYVLIAHIAEVPEMLRLIFVSAFTASEAAGAFLGGTAGYAFLWGMKRALFSSEAGQGSAPIAHSAAKTDQPVREGVVSGLEPFIDTLVVCTLTTLVILLSGAWNRGPEAIFDAPPQLVNTQKLVVQENARERQLLGAAVKRTETHLGFLNNSPRAGEAHYREWPLAAVTSIEPEENLWQPHAVVLPPKTAEARRISGPWRPGISVFVIVHAGVDPNTGRDLQRLHGIVREADDGLYAVWNPVKADTAPRVEGDGLYNHFVGAALTGHAFDRVMPGLGMWLVTIACWLFAISTMISWAYYGEQGVVYLLGQKGVLLYKLAYCTLIVVATVGFIQTDEQLDAWTALGTGVMLFANIPIMLLFGHQAMNAYHRYIRELDAGEFKTYEYPRITDVVEGRDGE